VASQAPEKENYMCKGLEVKGKTSLRKTHAFPELEYKEEQGRRESWNQCCHWAVESLLKGYHST
jgi:hypothetical protein